MKKKAKSSKRRRNGFMPLTQKKPLTSQRFFYGRKVITREAIVSYLLLISYNGISADITL
ncbi:protein of unknown function [Vibrio tapetis subsp. tapetis]|uniref:Uncharacterized protein n=1 Tax=Vibrio tapetis subsp. tapetis TaxID=1671868 RepID=A0A2N8ZF23_9VIBR|nr:protein of unknown function [Vibrio tapetis subsp. tapetis]